MTMSNRSRRPSPASTGCCSFRATRSASGSPQHSNVLKAAKAAGVKRLAYTSLIAADTSTNPLAGEHKATEEAIRASGLEFVILRNNWYTENFLGDVAGAKQTGTILAAVKNGKVASALKAEYAEAAVRALMDDAHAGKTFELAGKAWTYPELAKAVSAVIGKPVAFKTVSEAEKKAALLQAGLPEAERRSTRCLTFR